jgi:hypothetical protein
MNREELLAKILNKRVKDYSFPIVFFIIFSIFIFFAIRPNLVTAFSLQRELEELRIQDEQYEQVILNIVNYQTVIEKTRDDIPLLQQAIPDSPEIFAMVNDIKNGASESGIIINDLNISDVTLKEGTKVVDPNAPPPPPKPSGTAEENRKYTVNFQVQSNFSEVKAFIQQLLNQRRMKIIEHLDIVTAGEQGTQSATFNVSFIVDGYYL